MTRASTTTLKLTPLLSTITAMCLSVSSVHATSNPWKDVVSNGVRVNAVKKAATNDKNMLTKKERLMLGDISELAHVLTHSSAGTIMTLPLPDNTMANYAFTYDAIMAPELAKKYPEILTFTAVDTRNPNNTGRFSLTPRGFHGIFTHNGKRVLIDPKMRHGSQKHAVYYEKDALPMGKRKPDVVRHLHDETHNKAHNTTHEETAGTSDFQRFAKTTLLPAKRTVVKGNQLTTYRLAVSASGEYTQFHGGNVADALAAITTTINRVNEVYERDMAVKFELVANNDKIIFTNANKDPFINDDENDLDANEAVIRENIGLSNVDIAHVFNTGGGGLATLASVCTSAKTQGITGNPIPTGDSFDYSYVAHELGHQMGATHSFNGTAGSCGEDNRTANSAWEPGSGSTIMSYAGICGSDNLQAEGDAFFHVGSIQQIQNNISPLTCGKKTPMSNQSPTANAGKNHTIPAYTPFKLTGSGSDPDANDTLTYIWEQFNLGKASDLNTNGSAKDVGSGALFRSYEPVSTPVRYFPKLSSVLNNTASRGEGYPQTDRTLSFNLTVRDNLGSVATDRTTITVKNTGRAFSVIQPSASTRWPEGGQGRVVWDRAGTTEAEVNCQNVDILYDTGSGTYSTVLSEKTPNDGEQVINVPSQRTVNAKVMVSCSDNVFYAVNKGRFSIVNTTNATPLDTTPVPDGASSEPPPASSNTSEPLPTNTNNSGGSSGGSGGGSIPPIMVWLLMAAALVSTGCKTISQKEINDLQSVSKQHNHIDLSVAPEVAAKHAIAHNDLRLFATSGRLRVPVGIPIAEREQAKWRCGMRLIPGSGDVLTTQIDLEARKALVRYAIKYNLTVYESCRDRQ